MKYVISILIFLISITIFSCKKNADSTDQSNNMVVGKWHIAKDSVNYYSNNIWEAVTINTYDNTSFIQFNTDGSGNNSNKYNFTYKVDNNFITFYNQDYFYNGSEHFADTVKAQIQTLTSSSLNIYSDSKIPYIDNGELETNTFEYLTKD